MKNLNNEDLLVTNSKRIHMIGIGGSGMCPLAEILHSKGHILTGSDNNESDPLSRVKALGIKVSMGHKAENVHGADLVVYSAAISKDNPELIEAARLGIPTLERSHLLGSLTRRYDNVIGVSGTHGKTTTSSIITQIFVMANMDPTAVIGGKLPLINANGIAGNSEHMICESCEFVDTFLCLSPDIAVLLNIDNDHLDYFGSMERLCESFGKFVGMAHTAVINGDDPLCLEIANNFNGKCYTFGKNETNDYVAKNVKPNGEGMEFDIYKNGEFQIKIELGIPGEHNVYNALAAYVSADICGVNPEDSKKAVATFSGAGRRFEKLGTYKGIAVADDYAHHPTELTATLTAAKNMGYNNVIAVFQPFTFSRTELLKDDFIKALSIADKVVLTPIMGSRERNKTGISSNDLAKGLNCAWVAEDFAGAVETLLQIAKEGDLVITMGGGEIYKAARMYIERLK